ncbi:MAG: bifunctional DNA-binding transcriptional regulator/O6-methylguanine-DNA methyltransferase Ada [Granulosicoccus sp.]
MAIDESIMRAAVAARDAKFDGCFIFGVVTTGIYCRPSCSSRAAKAENIRFFDSAKAARAAGFRACLRCKPDDHKLDVSQFIDLARYIDNHADDSLPLAFLAKKMNLSPAYVQKKFKAVFGVSPKAYQDAARMKSLKSRLKSGDSITTAIYESGYGSSSRLYEKAGNNIGMTPKAYRAGGQGEHISYAYRESSLGPLMMAATDRGICFVMFGKSAKSLLLQLKAEFPNASLVETAASNGRELEQWMSALEQHLSDGTPLPDTPLDIRGTAFQIKVWQFLLTIPEGDVVSYTDVATGIEKPNAVRAAASACARNKIALYIPCHRVLRADGALGGYRWDVERKRVLLDNERRSAKRQAKQSN